jgi:hypothetical protein
VFEKTYALHNVLRTSAKNYFYQIFGFAKFVYLCLPKKVGEGGVLPAVLCRKKINELGGKFPISEQRQSSSVGRAADL